VARVFAPAGVAEPTVFILREKGVAEVSAAIFWLASAGRRNGAISSAAPTARVSEARPATRR